MIQRSEIRWQTYKVWYTYIRKDHQDNNDYLCPQKFKIVLIMSNENKSLKRMKRSTGPQLNVPLFDEGENIFVEPENWTVISALNRVLDLAKNCKLNSRIMT